MSRPSEENIKLASTATLRSLKREYEAKYQMIMRVGAIQGIVDFHRRNLDRVYTEIDRRHKARMALLMASYSRLPQRMIRDPRILRNSAPVRRSFFTDPYFDHNVVGIVFEFLFPK